MTTTSSQQYQVIEQAILYLLEHQRNQPSLKEVAAQAGMSEYHFQRTFVKWAGISPKRFVQFLNKEYIKQLLKEGYSTLDACYQAGLSSPSRGHDLFINTEAMTPGQYKAMGKDLDIHYGFHPSIFGEYLLALTDQGICHLSFYVNEAQEALDYLHQEWTLANIRHDQEKTRKVHQQLFGTNPEKEIKLLLKGTNFQIQVWQALLKIPFGKIDHYQGLATKIGQASASRASASAIARNKIAYLIPCHRIVRKAGETGDYRWGSTRKAIMLAYESAIAETASELR